MLRRFIVFYLFSCCFSFAGGTDWSHVFQILDVQKQREPFYSPQQLESAEGSSINAYIAGLIDQGYFNQETCWAASLEGDLQLEYLPLRFPNSYFYALNGGFYHGWEIVSLRRALVNKTLLNYSDKERKNFSREIKPSWLLLDFTDDGVSFSDNQNNQVIQVSHAFLRNETDEEEVLVEGLPEGVYPIYYCIQFGQKTVLTSSEKNIIAAYRCTNGEWKPFGQPLRSTLKNIHLPSIKQFGSYLRFFCSDSSSASKKYPILYMLDLKTGWLLGPLKDKSKLITSMQVIGDDLYFIDIHEDDDTAVLKTINLISMKERVVIKGSNGEQVQGFGCFSNSQGEVNLYVQMHGLKGLRYQFFDPKINEFFALFALTHDILFVADLKSSDSKAISRSLYIIFKDENKVIHQCIHEFLPYEDAEHSELIKIQGINVISNQSSFEDDCKDQEIPSPNEKQSSSVNICSLKYSYNDCVTNQMVQVPLHILIPHGTEVEGKKQKAIIYLHGGPGRCDDAQFKKEKQFFVNRGYVVVIPNVRGSSGFGEKHRAALEGDINGGHIRDVLAVAEYVKDLPFVDATDLTLWGASWGAYEAMLIATTPEYKGIFNKYIVECGLYDIRLMFQGVNDREKIAQLFGSKFQSEIDVKEYEKYSIVTSHKGLRNALNGDILFMHGGLDTLTPIWQLAEIKNALYYQCGYVWVIPYIDYSQQQPRVLSEHFMNETGQLARFEYFPELGHQIVIGKDFSRWAWIMEDFLQINPASS